MAIWSVHSNICDWKSVLLTSFASYSSLCYAYFLIRFAVRADVWSSLPCLHPHKIPSRCAAFHPAKNPKYFTMCLWVSDFKTCTSCRALSFSSWFNDTRGIFFTTNCVFRPGSVPSVPSIVATSGAHAEPDMEGRPWCSTVSWRRRGSGLGHVYVERSKWMQSRNCSYYNTCNIQQ